MLPYAQDYKESEGKLTATMTGLRVLICNVTLATRTGTETYVRDLALGLLARGHTPLVYSTNLGELAQELRQASVLVVDNLEELEAPPDIIHGNHNLETLTALLHFPHIPAIYFFHDPVSLNSTPPHFPRILRYVAVDHTRRDCLIFEHGIPEERVRVLHNSVDLKRFQPRPSLPPHPQRALIFNNNAHLEAHVKPVQEACARVGLPVDVMGAGAGTSNAHPEAVLGQYDLVFAVARCCLESLATGTAVILCDHRGTGPMVTTANWEQLRNYNFGLRTLVNPTHPDVIVREIACYDPADTAEVSQQIRASAGLDEMITAAIAHYEEVIAEYSDGKHSDFDEEGRAASAFLRSLSSQFKERDEIRHERNHYQSACNQLLVDNNQLRVERAQLLAEHAAMADLYKSRFMKSANRLRQVLLSARRVPARAKRLGARLTQRPQEVSATQVPETQLSKPQSPTMKEIFTDVYVNNAWGDAESVSGTGSTLARTGTVREALPTLLQSISVKSLLDIPCGDFNWMQHVTLDGIQYIGADVVPDLIERNRSLYEDTNRSFTVLDLICDQLPKVDVILCRDCLIHFSFGDIEAAIHNFKRSGSTYLLATTHKSVLKNEDTPTGGWRSLNLQLPPFSFPEPQQIIVENSGTGKCLGLWRLSDLHPPAYTS